MNLKNTSYKILASRFISNLNKLFEKGKYINRPRTPEKNQCKFKIRFIGSGKNLSLLTSASFATEPF